MSFTLSQVMANLESELQEVVAPERKNPNRSRTLKRRPEPQLNKLKNTTKSSQPLSDDIYLEDGEAEREVPDNKPQPGRDAGDEPSEGDYQFLGMGHPDNNFAEEQYKAYLNTHKNASPLIDQSKANELRSGGDYQQQYAAGYNQYKAPEHNEKPKKAPENDALLKKLNYMIHLLEEQKNEQTNNVTEELILYIFLGIFVIFVVDSFTKVGKYQR